MARGHLTYANVMATAAVFIALGGGTYAAVHLSRNSVRSRNIANGQVKQKDLAGNAVNSAKIKDGQVAPADLAPQEGFKSAGLVQNPTFNCANAPNAWASSHPADNGEVGYQRDRDGFVHLSGDAALCGSAPTGAVVFVLPPGYRPGGDQEQAGVNNSNYLDVLIDSDGSVAPFGAVGGAIV